MGDLTRDALFALHEDVLAQIEGPEEPPFELAGDRGARGSFDHRAGEDVVRVAVAIALVEVDVPVAKAFARPGVRGRHVAERLPRRPAPGRLLLQHTPKVLLERAETARETQELTEGDLRAIRNSGDVLSDSVVESKDTVLGQLQNEGGGEILRDVPDREERVGPQRFARAGVGDSALATPESHPGRDHRSRDAGEVVHGAKFVDNALERGGELSRAPCPGLVGRLRSAAAGRKDQKRSGRRREKELEPALRRQLPPRPSPCRSKHRLTSSDTKAIKLFGELRSGRTVRPRRGRLY